MYAALFETVTLLPDAAAKESITTISQKYIILRLGYILSGKSDKYLKLVIISIYLPLLITTNLLGKILTVNSDI